MFRTNKWFLCTFSHNVWHIYIYVYNRTEPNRNEIACAVMNGRAVEDGFVSCVFALVLYENFMVCLISTISTKINDCVMALKISYVNGTRPFVPFTHMNPMWKCAHMQTFFFRIEINLRFINVLFCLRVCVCVRSLLSFDASDMIFGLNGNVAHRCVCTNRKIWLRFHVS